jgi:hypothetical protein
MTTKVATPQAVRDKISAVIDTDWLSYLYGRWQNEREYEDINDYGKAFTKNTGWPVVKCSKRPFGFTFKVPEVPNAVYEIKVTARSAAWRRIV